MTLLWSLAPDGTYHGYSRDGLRRSPPTPDFEVFESGSHWWWRSTGHGRLPPVTAYALSREDAMRDAEASIRWIVDLPEVEPLYRAGIDFDLDGEDEIFSP